MTGHYAYTPYIWPMLASPALLLVPAAYAWRHRCAPEARPFVALVVAMLSWHLAQLVAVAQDAHADVRDSILGSRSRGADRAAFLPSLQDYLARFRANQTERVLTTGDLLRVIEGRTGTATRKT